MQTRSHYYYNARGLKIRLEDADDQMYFKKINDVEDMTRNTRDQLCVVYDDSVLDLPDDMVFVIYHRAEGTLFFLEKWKLYFLEGVNIVRENKEVRFYIPYNTFKSMGSASDWIEYDASNITWDSIKNMVIPEEKPKDLSDQISHFQHAIRESGRDA